VDETGAVLFGLGRLKMLEAVREYGSISAAAKALKMSHRRIWGRIKLTEERLGQPLLVRNVGGASGGGCRLTPYAQSLIDDFHFLYRSVELQADRLFDETREDHTRQNPIEFRHHRVKAAVFCLVAQPPGRY